MARVFSGIQPTGDFHLGNYIGAVRHWVPGQDDNDTIVCIVDLHAITQPQDPADLRRRTLELAAILLVAGIDPDRSILFVQSHVAEHAQLAWVLNCIATMGELRRMTQFKEKMQRGEEGSTSAGVFVYPTLMAADVLLYHTEEVPVGEDQRQHLELTRDIAMRFNRRFGETFVVPEPSIPKEGARIMDLQDPSAKMSKSAASAGTIAALDPPDVLRRKIRTAVTDSGREVLAGPDKPAITNLLTIFAAVTGRSIEDLEKEYRDGGYAPLKDAMADAVVALLEPFQREVATRLADPAELSRVLEAGAGRARSIASKTLDVAYDRVGFLPGRNG
jgi:tryptophanyl-tRNA synthetase